jgi:hypothetical protein
MKLTWGIVQVSLAVGLVVLVAHSAAAQFHTFPVRRCGPAAVVAGTVCMDRYEASVWRVPDATTTNAALVWKIQLGRVSHADLTAAGATQLGTAGDDYEPCKDTGQNCANDIYAVSLPSETPSADITWFQAQEACANAGKRLPTNCNTTKGLASLTGSRSKCVSARGAFDMVGNLAEWVADWVPLSTSCPNWGSFSDDFMCLAGTNTTGNGPGALLRGGHFFHGRKAGPLAVFGTFEPSRSAELVGFRCVR